jgi:gamma-glutamyltranspeptidase/glutathione hydrolase
MSLAAIAESHGESFYRGDLAKRMIECATTGGGALTLEDLEDHDAEWVEPISIDYRGKHLHEIPPNGQGLAAGISICKNIRSIRPIASIYISRP